MTRPHAPHQAAIDAVIDKALAEDLGDAGDITTTAVVPAAARSSASIVARESGTVAGLDIALRVFERVDGSMSVRALSSDGERVEAGSRLAKVSGSSRSILIAERTALNLLGHLSGIATATRELADLIAHTGASVVDTRKTTPGLRVLEKYAVRAGGGSNHRFGLYDAILIKDNHIAARGSLAEAVKAAQEASGHMVVIEVEVDTLEQLEEAIGAGADIVLLDNMAPETLREAVAVAGGRCTLEASGGITRDTITAVAESGVDLISVGWITHSAPQWDVALDFESNALQT